MSRTDQSVESTVLDPRIRRSMRDLTIVEAHIGAKATLQLAREAAARGTTAAVLAAVIVEMVCRDDLFDAVLDLKA